jgi:hypothetical protein
MQIEFHTFDLAKEITEQPDNGQDPVKVEVVVEIPDPEESTLDDLFFPSTFETIDIIAEPA